MLHTYHADRLYIFIVIIRYTVKSLYNGHFETTNFWLLLLQDKDFLFQRLNCISDTKNFVLMMEGFFSVPRRFVKRGCTVYTIKKNRMFLNFKL